MCCVYLIACIVTMQHGSKECFCGTFYSTALRGIVLMLSYKLLHSAVEGNGLGKVAVVPITQLVTCDHHDLGNGSQLA